MYASRETRHKLYSTKYVLCIGNNTTRKYLFSSGNLYCTMWKGKSIPIKVKLVIGKQIYRTFDYCPL